MPDNEHIKKGAELLLKALEDAPACAKFVVFGRSMYVNGVPDPNNTRSPTNAI